MTETEAKYYEFGGFRLERAFLSFSYEKRALPLPPKALEVLLVLASREGGIVSKAEMMEAVWPDSFVEESNLSQTIYLLRKVIEEASGEKNVIENIPRRGYRIAIPVSAILEEEEPVANKTAAPVTAATSGKKWIFAAAACMVIAALGLTAFLFYRAYSRGPEPELTLQRLTFSGDITFPVISPDAKTFAYVRDNSIYLQDIGTGSSLRLAIEGQKNFGNLQFSPSGENIFFRNESQTDAGGDIFEVSRFGGQPRQVAENSWSTPAFSADGVRMAFIRHYPERAEWALIERKLRTGEEKTLLSRNDPVTIFRSGYPAWAPDGRHIAVIEQVPNQKNASRLLIVDTSGGEPVHIDTPRFVQIEQPVWTPGGDAILLAGREDGRFFQLWKVGYPDGEVKRLTNDLNIYRSISLSADGRTMLTRQNSIYSHIWTAPANDPGRQKQITFGNLNRDGGVGLRWMPDGKILYSARISGNVDLWSVDPDSGVRLQLTENTGTNNESPAITPDGTRIFFESTRSGSRHIWQMDADGTAPQQVTLTEKETEYYPNISPDGQWLFYLQRAGKGSRIIRHSLADGREEDVLANDNLVPRAFIAISPDGRFMAFEHMQSGAAKGTSEVAVKDLKGAKPISRFIIDSIAPSIYWNENSTAFYFVSIDPEGSTIWMQSFSDPKDRKEVLRLPKEIVNGLAWSVDGKQIAISRGKNENDVLLLKGF